MEKRYQVFISSTFQDLQNARQEVSQALLRADCFPAGMELFPAADEEQFEFIKTVIDQSDYYIIISAGRYGSIHPETGLSYTEMEYDYAVETGKPVIRLLHKDPFRKLEGEFIEDTDEGRSHLKAFRMKLEKGTLVKHWSDPKEMMAETVFALQDIQKRKPATGWVRADGRASEEVELEVFRLKDKLRKFEHESNDERLEHALHLDIPLFQACLKRDIGDDSLEVVDETLESLSSLFDEGTQYKSEISAKFLEWGFGEEASHFLVDGLVTDELIELSAPGSELYQLSDFGRDAVSRARLRVFLSS